MGTTSVKFLDFEQLSKAGDYIEIVFSFSLVDAYLVGRPEEDTSTTRARVSVRMTRSLQSIWRLESPRLEKVMFEYAKRALQARVSRGSPKEYDQIDLNTTTAPSICPFDPDRITITPGAGFQVEAQRPLGFRK